MDIFTSNTMLGTFIGHGAFFMDNTVYIKGTGMYVYKFYLYTCIGVQ